MRYKIFYILLLQFITIAPFLVSAQEVISPATLPQDTIPTSPDSVALAAPQGDIQTTIKYSASDSIVLEANNKIAHLYGNAKIEYGTVSLEAAYIEINYDTHVLSAAPATDSTGKEIGVPVFKDGGETFAAKKIAYNIKSKKGLISEVVTQQGEGYIHGEVVKRNEKNEFSVFHAQYTTCNLEHPHFYINAGKIKAIPNEKVLSGPFNLVIGDIPTPLGFAFGLFPTPKQNRSSGVLVPTFGESRARGFFLSNGGYYLALNDYIGTSITGDIYSLGGYKVNMNNSYFKRYAYNGNLSISYDYFKNDEADIEQSRARAAGGQMLMPPTTRSIWINWSHSPVQKPGRGRFSANVSAGSSLFNRVNMTSSSNYLTPTFTSSIAYQKTIPNSPFSFGITLRQSQQNGGATTDLTQRSPTVMSFVLPDMNFAMTQMSISEMLTSKPPTGEWYEKFTFGYNVNLNNTVVNRIDQRPNTIQVLPVNGNLSSAPIVGEADSTRAFPLNFNNLGQMWRNGKRQANHNFSIGLGNYKVARYFNLTPSINYSEIWTDERFSYTYIPEANAVRVDTTSFGRVYQYGAGASLSTNVYGTVQVKGKRIEAIRHVMRPTVSYAFSPNYGGRGFDYYQEVQIGVTDTITKNPVYGRARRYTNVPGGGLQSGLSFNVQNNVEMKVRSKSDSTANSFEKVSLIDNLGASTFYNFAADSFKLQNINLNLNTRLFKIFNFTVTSVLDPYQYNAKGRRLDKYTLPRFANASMSLGASFNPASQGASPTAPPTNLPALEDGIGMRQNLPSYVDFKIPWTLSMDFTLYYARSMTAEMSTTLTKNFGFNGSVNLTEKWKVAYNAYYDFTNNNIANASLNIHRDLHCWDMSISWIPFGFMRGYNLTINARSSLLRDLRLTRNRSGWNR